MKNRISSYSGTGRLGVRLCAATGFALIMASTACAGLFGAKEIPSAWNESAIKVDGDGAEWDADGMTEKGGLAVSAANDDKNLYIYAAALDRDSAAQLSGIFKQTFTLWLDGKDGKKKVYGIKLEIKGVKEKEGEAKTQPSQEQSWERKMPEPRAVSYEAGIVDKDGPLFSLDSEGVEFKSGLNRKKRPVFEFKIPLAKLISKNVAVVGAGFETSEITESSMPGKRNSESGSEGGRSGGSGMGGPGGRSGGGRRGPPPGGGSGIGGPGGISDNGPGMGGPGGANNSAPTLPDPISFWLKIKLARKIVMMR
ncbi:MAG: hypothetical protein NTX59_11160 [Elusimicrobia bacterium]|nr:hypothetical protein [Elusimicrobiota bacterium]